MHTIMCNVAKNALKRKCAKSVCGCSLTKSTNYARFIFMHAGVCTPSRTEHYLNTSKERAAPRHPMDSTPLVESGTQECRTNPRFKERSRSHRPLKSCSFLRCGAERSCQDPHGTKLQGARDDARFAWDECACHRRSARDRPAMLPCMPCSCSTCS